MKPISGDGEEEEEEEEEEEGVRMEPLEVWNLLKNAAPISHCLVSSRDR